jgi:hypothetical protein
LRRGEFPCFRFVKAACEHVATGDICDSRAVRREDRVPSTRQA